MVAKEVRQAILQLVGADSTGAVITVLAGPGAGNRAVVDSSATPLTGTLPAELEAAIKADALALMEREKTVTLGYGEAQVFFEVIAPRPQLFVFGAVHIAQELVDHASLLGFRTVVTDPRSAFVTRERFPNAGELRVGWPDEVCDVSGLDHRTFVVILTHDRRFEDPLWPIALASSARYIGAMGSAKTTAKRRERLLASGFTEDQVDRIHGPIGLKIGSQTAGETAIAIIAEMIMVRYVASEEPSLVGIPLRA